MARTPGKRRRAQELSPPGRCRPLLRQAAAPAGSVARFLRHDQCRGRIQQHDVAEGRSFAGQQGADGAARCRRHRRPRYPQGRSGAGRPLPASSRAAKSCRSPAPPHASPRQSRSRPGRRRCARSRPAPCRVRAARWPPAPAILPRTRRPAAAARRPDWTAAQQIEDRAKAEFAPHRRRHASSPDGRRARTGKQKSVSARQRSACAGARSTRTPSCSSTSAAPLFDDMLRLPCLATGTPQAATTKATAVETFSVPSPSPPVPQTSMAPGGALDGAHGAAHRPRRADDLVHRGPAHGQRGEERRDARLADVAPHHGGEGAGDSAASSDARRRPRASAPSANSARAHAGTRAKSSRVSRKFCSSAWPFSEAMLSGWNCTPCTGWLCASRP